MKSIVRNARGIVIIAVCCVIVGYTAFESRNLLGGPILSLEEPTNGMTTKQPVVEVRGTARNIVAITLNDRPITTDESGVFSAEVPLSVGYNVTKIAVEDRFGRKKEQLIEITRKESLKEELGRK